MRVVAVGEVMMRLMTQEHKRLFQTNTLKFLFSGTGVNVLSGLFHLGEDVALATTLPDNVVGLSASAAIRKLGISDAHVNYHGNHIGIYILEPGTGNRATHVTYLNRVESSFGVTDVSNYDIDATLAGADLLHLCGITLALNERTRAIALAFAKRAKELGIKVFFDCNYRASLWENQLAARAVYEELLACADIVSANWKDADLLLGLTVDDALTGDARKLALMEKMQATFGIAVLFGTIRTTNELTGQKYLRGYILDQEGYLESKDYGLTIYDRVGGGDAFAACALHALHTDMTRRERVEFATVGGVLGHTTYGDSPVTTKAEIEAYLAEGPQEITR